MNPAGGLELHDIHLPAAPGWWPPAPGWWIAAAIVLAAMTYLCVKVYQYAKQRRLQRAVMGELDRCVESGRNDPAQLAACLSQFLRRLALRTAPQAAAYRGEQWVTYLDEQVGTDQFSRGVGRVLLDAPYDPHPIYDSSALIALVRRLTRNTLDKKAKHA
jgi:Domain of unknown function (DUF4381)